MGEKKLLIFTLMKVFVWKSKINLKYFHHQYWTLSCWRTKLGNVWCQPLPISLYHVPRSSSLERVSNSNLLGCWQLFYLFGICLGGGVRGILGRKEWTSGRYETRAWALPSLCGPCPSSFDTQPQCQDVRWEMGSVGVSGARWGNRSVMGIPQFTMPSPLGCECLFPVPWALCQRRPERSWEHTLTTSQGGEDGIFHPEPLQSAGKLDSHPEAFGGAQQKQPPYQGQGLTF